MFSIPPLEPQDIYQNKSIMISYSFGVGIARVLLTSMNLILVVFLYVKRGHARKYSNRLSRGRKWCILHRAFSETMPFVYFNTLVMR
jgi:hypothetical protein